ncbi:MAG TPA: type IV pilus biogenesis/stability protein PilW [Gammaproteobacteria bacterium]|nr:type IV pilus biogenesis/stability protein PilW [Gammaproteobacteria bacterium]
MATRSLLLAVMLLLAGCTTTQSGTPTESEKAARINTQLGIAYLRQDNLDQALDRLTKAVQQDPGYAEAHAVLAVLHHRLGQHDDAGRHYRRSVALAPDDSALRNNYGQFLCERGSIDEAERHLKRAAANPLYRTPEIPLSNAGVCLLRAGREEVAESYFLEALRHNPSFARALYAMAELRQRAGESLSARGFYQRYLAVAPQTAESLWLGIQIERVLGDNDAVGSYGMLLKGKFPDSEETRRLIELEKQNG